MKSRFLLFLFLFPVLVKAQPGAWQGVFEIDCNKFVLDHLLARDTIVGNLAAELLRPGVTTLIMQRTPTTEKLGDSVGKYRIELLDIESKKELKAAYKELKDSTASFFYMSEPQAKYAYYHIYVMPMYIEKKGWHYRTAYAGNGCKCTFYMDYSKSRFGYDRTACF